ncbi:glucokinase [Sandarakinorhabdus limnophila]|uniref:glucokinase n=1 Tax=Sandarakinorhabdus limnophila TaxID=210512 RepID=UPI0026F1E20B|nr:glucokinase [Sandarakinorhabdus limnophila]
MTELVATDIGGTHARFALARLDGEGRVAALDEPVVLRCADHASLHDAWECFGTTIGRPLPRAAALAVAGPVVGPNSFDTLKLTNNPWVIRPAMVNEKLGVDAHVLVNDFEAVAYAVGACGPDQFQHLCGPDVPLPETGTISVLGPGTGLGVGLLVKRCGNDWQVLPTEGSHGDFSPVDSLEDAILAHFRRRFGRVSAERVISGPGLADIHAALAALDDRAIQPMDDKTLWSLAMNGEDSLAAAALDRFCLALGTFAGNIALAHGAGGVVIGGGLGARLVDHLPRSGFTGRFAAKGRFETLMRSLPVKLITHPQPGLFGAAAAFGRKKR